MRRTRRRKKYFEIDFELHNSELEDFGHCGRLADGRFLKNLQVDTCQKVKFVLIYGCGGFALRYRILASPLWEFMMIQLSTFSKISKQRAR